MANINLNKLGEYANEFDSKKTNYGEAQYLISGTGDALAMINSCLVLVDLIGEKTDDLFVASGNYMKKASGNYKTVETANSKQASSEKKKK